MRKESGNALKLISPSISSSDASSEEILLAARIYKELAMTNKAVLCYKDLLTSDYSYSSYLHLSDCFVALSMTDSASEYLKLMIKAYPDSILPYKQLIALSDLKKDSSLAEFVFENIGKTELVDKNLFEYIGIYLFKSDRYKESASFYKGILGIDAKYGSKESVQSFFFSGDYSNALKSINNYLPQSTQDTIFGSKFKGAVLFKLSMYDSSEYYYEKAFDMNDKDTLLAQNLANVYRKNMKDMKLMDLIDHIGSYNKSFSTKLLDKYFSTKE